MAWLLALLALPIVATAQPRSAILPGQHQWVVGGWWRQAQGLPQDRVIALRQTRDGFMWIGTRGGLARFDGVRFKTWREGVGSVPPAGEAFALVEAPDGGLWVGVYGGGVAHHTGGRFATLTTRDGLVDDYVLSLATGGDGALWIGTERGLSRYRDGRFTNFHVGDGLADESVRVIFAEPGTGSIYIGTNRGLQRMTDGRFEAVALSAGSHDVQVDSVIRDHTGRLWVGTSAGVYRLDGTTVSAYGPADGLSSRAVRAVFEDSVHRMWVATIDGLFCAETTSGDAVTFTSVITGADVTSVTEDREGSIWVGYRGYGLARLQRSLFRVFDATTGLPGSGVTTVYEGHDSTIWAGVGTALSAIRGTHVRTFGVESGLPDRAVSSLAEDASHHLWVGTEAGLFRSTIPIQCGGDRCDVRFAAVIGHPALRTHIRTLKVRRDAVMLAGTNASGVIAVPTRGATPTPAAIVPGEVRAMVVESPDRVWIGRRGGGLLLVTPSGITAYTTREGLADDSIQALFLDREGTLWIGTRRGVSWLREGRFQSITAAGGLHESHVYGITGGRDGRLWFSSGSGVFSVAKRDMHEYAAGTRPRVDSAVYGLEHGLPSTLCALSHDPVIITDANGHVWVATLGGLAGIDPATQRINPVEVPVHIETVTVDNASFPPTDPVEVRHDRGSVVFGFAAPSFVAPDKIVFRYRLEGFDAAWIDGGSSREARFTNISPGRYRFTVMAGTGDGRWSEPGASADLYMVPAFYQRAWFAAAVAAAIVGAGIGIGLRMHRAQVRRLEARERTLAERVDEALSRIKVLSGLLPVCAWCHRVRDDAGYWTQIEEYVRDHSQADFSHGVCPDCVKKLDEPPPGA